MQTVTAASLSSSGGNAAPQMMYIQLATAPPTHDRYPQTLSICMGSAQILIGLFCIIFNIVSLVFTMTATMTYGIAYVGHGFWCGTLFIVTGSIGIAAGQRKTKCKIVTYNVMSIISAAFASALLVCGVLGAVLASYNARYCNGYSLKSDFCYEVQVVVTMESFLAVFAVIATVLFILSSVICCKDGGCGNCCSESDVDRPVLVPIVCQQNTGQPSQGIQLAYILPSTTPFQEGPNPAQSSTRSALNESHPTPVVPLYPSAPAVSRSSSSAFYRQIDDGPFYDNYGIY